MKGGPWVRFYPSDWLAGTRGMTSSEAGIYITLIALMYERDGGVENNPARLARLCGASNSGFKRALEVLISEGKIIEEDGLLINKRVVEELFYHREKTSVARENAERRWGKKPNKNNEGTDATAMPRQCHGNAISESESELEEEEEKNLPSGGKKKAHRLPDDWRPSEGDVEYGQKLGLSVTVIEDQAERMRLWAGSVAGQKGLKRDWSLAFKGWLRRVEKPETTLTEALDDIGDAIDRLNGGLHRGDGRGSGPPGGGTNPVGLPAPET